MEQLRRLVREQKQKISLIYTHDCNSPNCSGDIVSIQAICKCAQSSFNICNQEKKSSDLFSSNDVRSTEILKSYVGMNFRPMINVSTWNRDRTIFCVIHNLIQ
jgi:hypothetical protein